MNKIVHWYWRLFLSIILSMFSFIGLVGTKGICPCCRKRTRYYRPYGTKRLRMNAECPHCGGAERDRIEALWLKNVTINENHKILHFAPEKWLYDILKSMKEYYPVDISADIPMVKQSVDITSIPYAEEFFDIIICNMVLEHVEDANRGMREISRVLKKTGYAIITVPIDEKRSTLQKEEYNTDRLRIKYYGEANHVRMYGNDFQGILKKNGLIGEKIFAKDLNNDLKKFGLKKKEYFWLCKKC